MPNLDQFWKHGLLWNSVGDWTIALVVFVVVLVGLWGVRQVFRRRRRKWVESGKSPPVALDLTCQLIEKTTSLFIWGMALYCAIEQLELRHVHAQFIFLDPPYAADEEYETALDALGESPLVAPGGRVIVEHLRKRKLPEIAGELEIARVVEQGDAALTFYRLALAA